MKIMYLLFSYTVGGTERLVADICNEMVSQEHEVYLYVVNNLYSEEVLNTLDRKVHIELQKRPVGSGGKIDTIRRVTKYIKDNQIEIVHCNSLDIPEILILKPFLFRKTKIVHTIHDVGQYGQLAKWKIILRNILCDNFVAISKSVKKDIVEHGAKAKKVVTVYNAINLEKFSSKSSGRYNPDKIVIGNVARFMPEKKGQDILVEAIDLISKKYPNVVCYFAGGYDNSHKKAFENLKRIIMERGIDNNIIFLGNVDNIPELLRTIDIFVLPSRFEGFGISLIEAMAMGIPCIASNLDGPAEIMVSNPNQLFDVGDSAQLAEKISYVIDNYDLIKKQAQNEINRIQKRFDIVNMCKKLIKVYTY
ncbi:glycosyltransferase involved in cell wall biosynthesis [Neobacillus niacini]|uniref:glycosyltransferase family 4 protein n=1 Tax=Neobacillus driksii TaxID=3035913 RepID=UPI00278662BE|nr:glycosyltransferase family 4 protein [Neobacillus niacini]MDQ0974608.1 glycosyltransferase involved in cell wall biosynthesis [Neobacillus niacini]